MLDLQDVGFNGVGKL